MEANTALGDDGGGVWNMTQWFNLRVWFYFWIILRYGIQFTI